MVPAPSMRPNAESGAPAGRQQAEIRPPAAAETAAASLGAPLRLTKGASRWTGLRAAGWDPP